MQLRQHLLLSRAIGFYLDSVTMLPLSSPIQTRPSRVWLVADAIKLRRGPTCLLHTSLCFGGSITSKNPQPHWLSFLLSLIITICILSRVPFCLCNSWNKIKRAMKVCNKTVPNCKTVSPEKVSTFKHKIYIHNLCLIKCFICTNRTVGCQFFK